MLSRYQSSKSNSAHGSRKHWNHSCVHVCWLSLCAYVCVCTVFWMCVLTVNACLCVFLNVEFDIHEHFSLFLSKVQQILDHPKLQAPKIEPWSHSFHRSGPPSSSTPTPHTVSITWTYRLRFDTKHVYALSMIRSVALAAYAHEHGAAPWDLVVSELLLWQRVWVVKVKAVCRVFKSTSTNLY